jgi:hypothetical protein
LNPNGLVLSTEKRGKREIKPTRIWGCAALLRVAELSLKVQKPAGTALIVTAHQIDLSSGHKPAL